MLSAGQIKKATHNMFCQKLDANVVESFTPKQLAIERIITKTFVAYHMNLVIACGLYLVQNYGEWDNLWGANQEKTY